MRIRNSLAFRLTLFFILLIFIPLGIYTYYLHNIITQNFYSVSVHFLEEQAQSIAVHLQKTGQVPSQVEAFDILPHDGHYYFVINSSGEYILHPEGDKIGIHVSQDFGNGFLGRVTSGTSGGGIIDERNTIYGFTVVPDSDLVIVSIGNLEDVRKPLRQIQGLSILQLLIGFVLTVVVAAVLIRRTVGKPLEKLTATADQLGHGHLDIDINPNEMKSEFKHLSTSLMQMRDQLNFLIQGLQLRIQELAQTQQSLKISDEQTRAIIDSVNEAIIVVDKGSGVILNVNKKIAEMYGFEQNEIVGEKINLLMSGELPYTHKYFMNYMKDAAQTGPQMFEWKAKHKAGRQFWVEINMRQATIGEKDCMLVAVREISERKRAEQVRTALYRISHSVQAAQNLNELFYLIHGIISDLMPAQNFYIALYNNEQDKFYYPYYVDQFDTTPAPHPLNKGLTSYVLRTGVTLLASPQVFDQLLKSGEVEMIGADSVDWLGAPLNINQQVIGVITVQTYTTKERLTEEDKDVLTFVSTQIAMAIERKRADDALLESEGRWRTLTENAPQFIMLLDQMGNIFFGNRLLPGMGSEGRQSQSFLEFVDSDKSTIVENALQEVFEKGHGISFEISKTESSDVTNWYACNLAPVVNDERVDMAILNASDITQWKDAEKSIHQLNEELEKRVLERTTQLALAVRELEAFSYSVSHDLRAPLRALDGYSRILEKEYHDVLDEDGMGYLNNIRSSTHKMGRLIDDLLTFSRLGRHPLEKQPVDMQSLVLQTIEEFSQDCVERGVSITVIDLPPCEGDAALLHQMWINLISNAIKFTRRTSQAAIVIGYHQKDEITYFIQDNGVGFDMKYADKLFGVFQRLHSVEEYEGTGVGLAIVERIIRRHNGRIWAESVPGSGATFFFTVNEKDGIPDQPKVEK